MRDFINLNNLVKVASCFVFLGVIISDQALAQNTKRPSSKTQISKKRTKPSKVRQKPKSKRMAPQQNRVQKTPIRQQPAKPKSGIPLYQDPYEVDPYEGYDEPLVINTRKPKRYLPEPFWQVGARDFNLELGVFYRYSRAEVSESLLRKDYNASRVGGRALVSYGITDEYGLGIQLKFSNNKYNLDTLSGNSNLELTGLEDIHLFFNGNHQGSWWGLYYGADVYLSPTKQQINYANSSGNNFSGGNSLAPYLGGSFKFDEIFRMGLKAQYRIKGEREVEGTQGALTTSYSYTGAHEISGLLFLEMGYKTVQPGLLVGYSKFLAENKDDIAVANEYSRYSLGAYLRFILEDNIHLVGKASYMSSTDEHFQELGVGGTLNSLNIFDADLAVRFTF